MKPQRHSQAPATLFLLVALACSGDPAQTVAPGALSLDRREATGGLGNPGVLPPNSHAFGKTYAEWSAQWWKWAFSLPVPPDNPSDNPFFDESGAQCANGQSGHVWFLAGVFIESGTAVRDNCVVPTGKALFFPILNVECSNVEGDAKDEDVEGLRACAKGFMDQATSLAADIDGQSIENLESYRVQSPAFNFTLPVNNFLQFFGRDAPPGSFHEEDGSRVPNLSVSDGFFLLLPPLSAGAHTIHFHGSVPGFTLDITYHLTVQ